MPEQGDIVVKISLSNLPERRRKPYCVEILEYRDSFLDSKITWRPYREDAGLGSRHGVPTYFRSLEKALKYKDSMLFWWQYNLYEQLLGEDSA